LRNLHGTSLLFTISPRDGTEASTRIGAILISREENIFADAKELFQGSGVIPCVRSAKPGGNIVSAL
jgi:hypothetical protein